MASNHPDIIPGAGLGKHRKSAAPAYAEGARSNCEKQKEDHSWGVNYVLLGS
jgi:hypothetical protein